VSTRPYADMSDEELDAELDAALRERRSRRGGPHSLTEPARQGDRTVPISVRVPSRLLARLKFEAERRGTPYQRLLLALVEDGLTRTAHLSRPAHVRIPAEAVQEGHVLIHVELLPPAASQ
jgi:predicted DNA binding CopG/RHH family protein